MRVRSYRTTLWVAALISLLVIPFGRTAPAAETYHLSSGQTLYVPVYANVFSAPKQVPFGLATILSIRNTDMTEPVTVSTADYYDTKGKLLRRYYEKGITLAPLESAYIYISEDDATGGFGANFIVRWKAAREVNAPIIECVMIGTKSGQGISFVSPGQEIKERTK